MQLNKEQLAAAARRLRIPVPSAEILEQVLAQEGTMLVRNVEEALKGQARSQQYLRGVLLACHESTQDRLRRARVAMPPITTLVAIGKAEGPQFGLRVKEWDERQFLDGPAARYVRLTVARFVEDAKQQPSPGPIPRGSSVPTAVVIPNALTYRPNRTNTSTNTPASQQGARRAQATDEAPSAASDDGGGRNQSIRTSTLDPHQTVEPRTRSAAQSSKGHPHQEGAGPAPHPEFLRSRSESCVTGAAGEFISHHIYGGRSAACFSADTTRSGTHTVRIEAAESSATRQYDWSGKIGIQLSQRELPLVLAVFMHWLPKFEGKGHGDNNSKWFTLENQGNKLFLSVSAKGRPPRAVPIMPGDGYAVTTLLVRQMLKNDPFLTPEIVLNLVQKEAALLTAPTTQRNVA